MQLLIRCRKQTMAAIRYLACATFPGRHSAKPTIPCAGLPQAQFFRNWINHSPEDMQYACGTPSSLPGRKTRPSSQPMNRSELYRWVMALGFCAYDMLLYLDTHPDDAQALSYYNQCNELYNSAKKTYEERFEPLSAFGSQPLEDWDWNDGPMPWEGVK